MKHLDAFFGGKRVAAIGSADITAYVAKRQREGASNSTINRDLAGLNRMLRLAYEHNKLLRPRSSTSSKKEPLDRAFSSASSSRRCANTCPLTCKWW